MPDTTDQEREELVKSFALIAQPYVDKLVRVASRAMEGVILDEPQPNNKALVEALADFVLARDAQREVEVRIEEIEWAMRRPHGGMADTNELRTRIKDLKAKLPTPPLPKKENE